MSLHVVIMTLQKIHNVDASSSDLSIIFNAAQQSLEQPICVRPINCAYGANFLIVGHIHTAHDLIQRTRMCSKVLYVQDANSNNLFRVILLNACAKEAEEAGVKEMDLVAFLNPRLSPHPALEWSSLKVYRKQIIFHDKNKASPSMWLYQQVQCNFVRRNLIKNKHHFPEDEVDKDLDPPPAKKLLSSKSQGCGSSRTSASLEKGLSSETVENTATDCSVRLQPTNQNFTETLSTESVNSSVTFSKKVLPDSVQQSVGSSSTQNSTSVDLRSKIADKTLTDLQSYPELVGTQPKNHDCLQNHHLKPVPKLSPKEISSNNCHSSIGSSNTSAYFSPETTENTPAEIHEAQLVLELSENNNRRKTPNTESVLSPVPSSKILPTNIQPGIDSSNTPVSCNVDCSSKVIEDISVDVQVSRQMVGTQSVVETCSLGSVVSPKEVLCSDVQPSVGLSNISFSSPVDCRSEVAQNTLTDIQINKNHDRSGNHHLKQNFSSKISSITSTKDKLTNDVQSSVHLSNTSASCSADLSATAIENIPADIHATQLPVESQSRNHGRRKSLDTELSPFSVPSSKVLLRNPQPGISSLDAPVLCSVNLDSEAIESILIGAQVCQQPLQTQSKQHDQSKTHHTNSASSLGKNKNSTSQNEQTRLETNCNKTNECPPRITDTIVHDGHQNGEVTSNDCSLTPRYPFDFKQLAHIKEGEVIHSVVVIQAIKTPVLCNSCTALVSVCVTDESIFPDVMDITIVTHVELKPLLKKDDIARFMNIHISSVDGKLIGKVFSGDDVGIYKSPEEVSSSGGFSLIRHCTFSDGDSVRFSKISQWQKQIKTEVRAQMLEVFGEVSDDDFTDIENDCEGKRNFCHETTIEKLGGNFSTNEPEHLICSELFVFDSSTLNFDQLLNLKCKVCNIYYLRSNKAVIHVEASSLSNNKCSSPNIPKKSVMKKLRRSTDWIKYLITSRFTDGSMFFFVESLSAPPIVHNIKARSQLLISATQKNERPANQDFETIKCDLKVINNDDDSSSTKLGMNPECEATNTFVPKTSEFNEDQKEILEQLVVKKSPSPQRTFYSSPVNYTLNGLKDNFSSKNCIRDVKVLLVRNPIIENMSPKKKKFLKL
nr:PREDICTED: uncharacterized protein LOC109036663 isoform X2 [Bemisia tabaci]